AYVHQQGLMHRDIKLDNIGLVDDNNSGQPPRVVLLDFGHATRNPTSTNHMKGTIRYLAPEVIALKRTAASHTNPYTNKVDTWALGICIYEL
ncbi:kinase-like domain-containing protein, partial [Cryomyces antarcticus]